MKNILISLGVTLLLSLSASSQDSNLTGMMFDEYTLGTVTYTNGQSAQFKLNYNMLTGMMMFLSPEGEEMHITNPEIVTFVQVNGRIFQHIKGSDFFERVAIPTKKAYYVRWMSSPISAGKASGYGGYSQTSATSDISVYDKSGIFAKIKMDEIFRLEEANKYFVVKNGILRQFSSQRSLSKLFPGHKAEISEFVKQQKINFKDSADIRKLMEFCAPFM